MRFAFEEFVEDLKSSEGPDGAFRALERTAQGWGFRCVDYASGRLTRSIPPSAADFAIQHYLSTFEWGDDYVGTDWQAHDRCTTYEMSRVTPWAYWDVMQHPPENAIQRAMEASALSRVSSGMGVPLHEPGGRYSAVHFGSELGRWEFDRLDREIRPAVHLIAAYFHEHVKGGLSVEPEADVLTPKERECLLWAAQGKTAWETSMILSLSERVVKKHVASAAEKLGAVTRAQAVAAAMTRGLIRP